MDISLKGNSMNAKSEKMVNHEGEFAEFEKWKVKTIEGNTLEVNIKSNEWQVKSEKWKVKSEK